MIVISCPACGERVEVAVKLARIEKYENSLTVTFASAAPKHTCPPDPTRDATP